MSNEKTLKEIILAEVQAVLDSYPDFTAEDATDNILDEVKALIESERIDTSPHDIWGVACNSLIDKINKRIDE